MDIVATSLDALLHKATNSRNQNIDKPAVEAFCALINKEKDGPSIGAKLLATRIHSRNEWEALHSLTILDASMKRCNNAFHSEIGKFRFLNEMIKLVSPKYLGSQTPLSVKQKVLQLLYLWTVDYPKEAKIKEAYEMLKKQGVIKEVPLSVCADNASIPERKVTNSLFNDEEKNRLLQKLLQSKNPADLQAANRLIKNMVKEDDKRTEIKNRKISELESVHNNIRLLNEMLDSYKPGISSADELELIDELHQSCERLRPIIFQFVADPPNNEEMLNDALRANDDLGQVFIKYNKVIVRGRIIQETLRNSQNRTLLDLGSSQPVASNTTATSNTNSSTATSALISSEAQPDMDLLCDFFTDTKATTATDDKILQPISSNHVDSTTDNENDVSEKSNKINALDDLNALGEKLLKESLVSAKIKPQFNKNSEKIPMNLLAKQSLVEGRVSNSADDIGKLSDLTVRDALNLDLNYLMNKETKSDNLVPTSQDSNGDDVLVDITLGNSFQQPESVDVIIEDLDKSRSDEDKVGPEPSPSPTKVDVKLNDISIKLEDIKPSLTPPLVVLQDKNGITVTLHFGKNKPRKNVSVIVVTTVSKNELPLTNFLFQAVVPKGCKLKLQPPSGTEFPAYNPFLPPSAITQVMLIANPKNLDISLKFIISCMLDGETITEMGEVDCLPFINN